jgi:hypothetical protein
MMAELGLGPSRRPSPNGVSFARVWPPHSPFSSASSKPHLDPTRRRALELLARSPHGATEQRMLADGFTRRMVTWVVRSGLALRYRMPLRVSGRTIEVTYVMITEAGRKAIERAPEAR